MIRRSPIETKVNHERWLISYADFITLLFGFFVVMYSISQVNENKYKVLSDTLESTFSNIVDSGIKDTDSNDIEGFNNNSNLAELTELSERLKESLSSLIDDDAVSVFANEEWVEITLNANILFTSGNAELAKDAKKLLTSVADILVPYDNAIAIAGHTDNLPISNTRFQNNWALSSARAVSVVNLMSFQGINPERLSAVGYGEYRPIVSNDTAQGRIQNRRVVLRVGRDAATTNILPLEHYVNAQHDDTDKGGAQKKITLELPSERRESVTPRPRPTASENAVKPVRLKGGGLLFSRDPNLPRNNPPVE
ncbi:flagellar motor protein MotB [Agarilytica rhodophyticola]|uniref:flagellar motor protein MotB n=1 Tax=Agarilytica rhodophyticola TaxID=1737490 RepID=UPI000B345D13|nr:flagellar motor protein MotB [Agarilytica rhodophyticola]